VAGLVGPNCWVPTKPGQLQYVRVTVPATYVSGGSITV
jgi:hypothetical protein